MRQAFWLSLLLTLLACTGLAAPSTTKTDVTVPATKDGKAFLAAAAVQRRVSWLIGRNNFTEVVSDFKRVGNLQNDAHVTAFIGCQENGCGINDALVIYNRDSDTFRILLHRDERPMQFQERGKPSTTGYNMALKSAIVNFGL